MNCEDNAIPASWSWVDIGSLGVFLGGGTPAKSVKEYWNSADIPWVSPKDMKQNDIHSAEMSVSKKALDKTSLSRIPKGSLIMVTRSGILSRTFPVAINHCDVVINQDLKALVPFSGINVKFLMLMCRCFTHQILSDCSKQGTTVASINTSSLQGFKVPLAPTSVQRRIVAKIEALFSEIDHGVEELKAAQKKLKRARQALLKAAFEGKLTARWRAENPDKLESPEALRQRIQAEREAYQRRQLEEWEKAVEEWRASGSEGRKPRKPKTLKVTNEAQVEYADGLPETWLCAVLGNLYVEASLGKMLDKEKNKGELRPYLRNVNVRWGEVVLDDVKKMRFEDDEKDRYSVVPGDLVICEGGEPGRCAVWKEEFGDSFMIQKALHRVRFGGSVSPTYVMHYLKLCTDAGRISHLYTGTTIKHLTGKALENVPIPLCGVFEQEKVVEIIESRLSEIDQLEGVLQASRQRAESLKQSILKQAFSGRLVPQDLDDEPASELLARIHAEREVQQQAAPRRRRRKPAEEATP